MFEGISMQWCSGCDWWVSGQTDWVETETLAMASEPVQLVAARRTQVANSSGWVFPTKVVSSRSTTGLLLSTPQRFRTSVSPRAATRPCMDHGTWKLVGSLYCSSTLCRAMLEIRMMPDNSNTS